MVIKKIECEEIEYKWNKLKNIKLKSNVIIL